MKASEILLEAGGTCLLIGMTGIDGTTDVACGILCIVSLAVATIGYIRVIQKEKQEQRRREELEAIARAKEATFQVWLKSGKLDVPF